MNAITNLMDGENVAVKFKNPSGVEVIPDGDVFVRRIPICDMDRLGVAWGKPKKEVAVYCDKPEEWVERLTDESFAKLMTKGRELNFTCFKTWFGWQAQTLEAMGQGSLIADAIKQASTKLAAAG